MQTKSRLGWKLLAALLFSAVPILVSLYVMTESDAERHRLLTEAVKDLGVVILGIAAVEIVWVIVGGSPTEIALSNLIATNNSLSAHMTQDVGSLSQATSEIKGTSSRIEQSLRQVTTLFDATNRTGVVNIGAKQDELGYPPSRFAQEVMNAQHGVDLCACTLALVYANDAIQNALVSTANRGVPVRILLPAPDSPLLVANFKDRFLDDIRLGAQNLINVLQHKQSKIHLKALRSKVMTICMLRIDEAMLVMPYMYETQTTESPRFDVRGSGSPLFRVYLGEFEALFKEAEEVPSELAPAAG